MPSKSNPVVNVKILNAWFETHLVIDILSISNEIVFIAQDLTKNMSTLSSWWIDI